MSAISASRRVASVVLAVVLAACTASPPPRSAANQSVAPDAHTRSPNAAYYTGADPDHPRSRAGGGGP